MGAINRLSVTRLAKLKEGRHCDGGGLNVVVKPSSAKSWVFRYMLNGKRGELGLGSLSTVTLEEARNEALRLRRELREGVDPGEARAQARAQAAAQIAKRKSFNEVADDWLEFVRPTLDPQTFGNKQRVLRLYVRPKIGHLPVSAIETVHVLDVLAPIWKPVAEGGKTLADDVRAIIEKVLNRAESKELRSGKNPAQWRNGLDGHLHPKSVVHPTVRHRRAMPAEKIYDFLEKLRAGPPCNVSLTRGAPRGRAPLDAKRYAVGAITLAVFTGMRINAVLGAQWSEFDLERAIWTVPARRMKGRTGKRKPNPLPLSPPAVALLQELKRDGDPKFVFAHPGIGKPLRNSQVWTFKNNAGFADYDTHGFRGSLETWAKARRPYYQEHIIDATLAHKFKDAVDEAYDHNDYMEQRRKLLDDWAAYVTRPPISGNVVEMTTAKLSTSAEAEPAHRRISA